MFNSKPVIFEDEPPKWYENTWLYKKYLAWYLESDLVDWYHDFTWKWFGKPVRDVGMVWGWYWNVIRFDYDFEAHCIFMFMKYKLERVQKILTHYPKTAIDRHGNKPLQALRLAIKLADRIEKDDYLSILMDRHTAKWGEIEDMFKCGRLNFDRPNADTPEKIAQEKEEYRKACFRSEDLENRDRAWFFGIINKYQRHWWD